MPRRLAYSHSPNASGDTGTVVAIDSGAQPRSHADPRPWSSDHAEADSDSVQLLPRRPSRDEGTEFWKFCFDLPENNEPDDPAQLDFLRGAHAHIMGRTAYEGIAGAMTTTATDHPFAGILNAGRKVVLSRTLKTADWAKTTIAAGDTAGEIDKLRLGGDGHIVVWGGVGLWRSLMELDLIDELRLSLFPLRRGRGHPAVRRRPQLLPARPGLQHWLEQRDRRAAVPPAPLRQWGRLSRR